MHIAMKNISILSGKDALRAQIGAWRKDGATIALVPTMGALHEGHLSLVREAKSAADKVVVSIFVNPTQFSPTEDFSAYPRNLDVDAGLLSNVNADLVYAPTIESMYPEGYCSYVTVNGPSEGLCGAFRPDHFRGVASVVTKLFMRVQPDIAFFGEKDYQQLQVIRRMVQDLDYPIRIEGVPIVRETDGLALSSRNAYLSREERAIAPILYKTLASVAEMVRSGEIIGEAEKWGAAQLLAGGFRSVDYLDVRNASSLKRTEIFDAAVAARVLVAAHLGRTRLIDNLTL